MWKLLIYEWIISENQIIVKKTQEVITDTVSKTYCAVLTPRLIHSGRQWLDSVDLVWYVLSHAWLLGRGYLVWVSRKPSIHVTQPTLTYSSSLRRPSSRLQRSSERLGFSPYFREMLTDPDAFFGCIWAITLRLVPTLKRLCAIVTRTWSAHSLLANDPSGCKDNALWYLYLGQVDWKEIACSPLV